MNVLPFLFIINMLPFFLQFDAGSKNKENRRFLMTHLCLWSKQGEELMQKPKSLIEKRDQVRSKTSSPFLIWKKQRTAGKSKLSQDDAHPGHIPKIVILGPKEVLRM